MLSMLQRQSGFYPTIASDDGLGCSYYPHQTGLQSIVVHCEPKLGMYSHVKVAAKSGRRSMEATVTISDFPIIEEGCLPPAVGRRVFRFIRSNRLVLQALWNRAIGYSDAAQRFRKG